MSVPVTDIREAKREIALLVIRQIDLYRGEVIEKDRHPLWMAAVALERLSRKNERSTVQPYRLDSVLNGPWMRCLWASRPDFPNISIDAVPHSEIGWYSTRKDPANPELAMAWAVRLHEAIITMLSE